MQPSVRTALDREAASMAETIEHATPIAIARARGAEVWDEDGRRYLDMTAGSGVLALGHSDPEVVAAVTEQAAIYAHGGWQFTSAPRAALVQQLAELLPWPDPVFLFCTTGTEAVEGVLKAARAVSGRRHVLGFLGGYHGKSSGALEVTANSRFRRATPSVPSVTVSLPFPSAETYLAPNPEWRPDPDFGQRLLEHPDFGLDDVAGLLLESVQGSGGMIAAEPGLLTALRRFTRERGLLLVLDEIFSGLGRTGTMWSFEHERVVPDLVVIGKALGGGLPVSVVAGPRDLMTGMSSLLQTSTFSANPVACAAGNVVLRRIREEALHESAAHIGRQLRDVIIQASRETAGIRITGQGAMLGFSFPSGDIGESTRVAAAVNTELRDHGVLALRSGAVIKLTPPLNLESRHINELSEALCNSILSSVEPA